MGGFHLLDVGVFHQHTTEVSVRDDALNLFVFSHYRRAKAFARHFDDDLRQAVVGAYFGAFVAGIEVFHAQIKLFAERAARVELGEVVGGKAPTPH